MTSQKNKNSNSHSVFESCNQNNNFFQFLKTSGCYANYQIKISHSIVQDNIPSDHSLTKSFCLISRTKKPYSLESRLSRVKTEYFSAFLSLASADHTHKVDYSKIFPGIYFSTIQKNPV